MLHDIITHKLEMVQVEVDSDAVPITMGLTETEKSEELLNNISAEADLSPRLLKTARKGKKQGNGEHSQPTRVQPKRLKAASKQ